MRTMQERFWEKVQQTETCWSWTAASMNGYGLLQVARRPVRAHRLSWELHFGEIPEDMDVLHKCDNRGCVRPDHLYLGTDVENARDRVLRGRTARGARHGSQTKPESRPRGRQHWARQRPHEVPRGERCATSRLTEEVVRSMKAEYLHGDVSQAWLAKKYGLSLNHVGRIIRGEAWAHVEVI